MGLDKDTRRLVWKQGDERCVICTRPVKLSDYESEPDGWVEVDHDPRGDLSLGNLRPAHFGCRARRGDRSTLEAWAELGIPVENRRIGQHLGGAQRAGKKAGLVLLLGAPALGFLVGGPNGFGVGFAIGLVLLVISRARTARELSDLGKD